VGLVVTTPATATPPASPGDLVDLVGVKLELGIADTKSDVILQELIADASGAIAQYCNRQFAQQVYDETLAGYGGTYLTLHETPIIAVASVAFQGQPIVDFSVEDAMAGMLYRQNLWTWTAQVGWVLTGYPYPRSEAVDASGAYEVKYTAGWILPTQNNPPVAPAQGGLNLPRDIVKAARDLVKFYFLRRKLDPEVMQRQQENLNIRWQQRDDSLPPDLPRPIAFLLRPYIKVFL